MLMPGVYKPQRLPMNEYPFTLETNSRPSLTVERDEQALATALELAGWRIHVSNASAQRIYQIHYRIGSYAYVLVESVPELLQLDDFRKRIYQGNRVKNSIVSQNEISYKGVYVWKSQLSQNRNREGTNGRARKECITAQSRS